MSFFWELYNHPPHVILREHKRPKNLKRFFTPLRFVQNDSVRRSSHRSVSAFGENGAMLPPSSFTPANPLRWASPGTPFLPVIAKPVRTLAVAIRPPLRSGYSGFPRSFHSLGMTFLHPLSLRGQLRCPRQSVPPVIPSLQKM